MIYKQSELSFVVTYYVEESQKTIKGFFEFIEWRYEELFAIYFDPHMSGIFYHYRKRCRILNLLNFN